jgi:hypothetical protein
MLEFSAPDISTLLDNFDIDELLLFSFSADDFLVFFPEVSDDELSPLIGVFSFFFVPFDFIEDILSSPTDSRDFLLLLRVEVIDEMLSSRFADFLFDGFNFFDVMVPSSLLLAMVLDNDTIPFFIMICFRCSREQSKDQRRFVVVQIHWAPYR